MEMGFRCYLRKHENDEMGFRGKTIGELDLTRHDILELLSQFSIICRSVVIKFLETRSYE